MNKRAQDWIFICVFRLVRYLVVCISGERSGCCFGRIRWIDCNESGQCFPMPSPTMPALKRATCKHGTSFASVCGPPFACCARYSQPPHTNRATHSAQRAPGQQLLSQLARSLVQLVQLSSNESAPHRLPE